MQRHAEVIARVRKRRIDGKGTLVTLHGIRKIAERSRHQSAVAPACGSIERETERSIQQLRCLRVVAALMHQDAEVMQRIDVIGTVFENLAITAFRVGQRPGLVMI